MDQAHHVKTRHQLEEARQEYWKDTILAVKAKVEIREMEWQVMVTTMENIETRH